MALFKRFFKKTQPYKMDVLSSYNEPDAKRRKELQEICNILNRMYIPGILKKEFTVEVFKIENKYGPRKYRFINSDRDVWIFFVGCTDGTHAPAGFRETEELIFSYKGFALNLHFEEQFEGPIKFKLKYVNTDGYHMLKTSELNSYLNEQGINEENYYHALREALDAQQKDRENYYGF